MGSERAHNVYKPTTFQRRSNFQNHLSLGINFSGWGSIRFPWCITSGKCFVDDTLRDCFDKCFHIILIFCPEGCYKNIFLIIELSILTRGFNFVHGFYFLVWLVFRSKLVIFQKENLATVYYSADSALTFLPVESSIEWSDSFFNTSFSSAVIASSSSNISRSTATLTFLFTTCMLPFSKKIGTHLDVGIAFMKHIFK